MDALDAINHLANLLLPAFGLAAIAAGLAKVMWRRELAAMPWWRLWLWAGLANAGVIAAGLVLFGRDGKMATYGAMLLANTLMLWWRGFGPGRR